MPSSDIVSEIDKQEILNAVDQARRELATRFDFKGSEAKMEIEKDGNLRLADDDFKLSQVRDVRWSRCGKRQVDVRFFSSGDVQKISGDKVKQLITVRKGVAGDDAKRIVRLVKESKLKVQASIQGDSVRVSGTKRDDLQNAIALLRKNVTDLPLNYSNFRD